MLYKYFLAHSEFKLCFLKLFFFFFFNILNIQLVEPVDMKSTDTKANCTKLSSFSLYGLGKQQFQFHSELK